MGDEPRGQDAPLRMKHLEFVQQAIDRTESNSILMKGWTIILVATLLGLWADDDSVARIYLLCLPVLAFWIVDSWFQTQLRRLRETHNSVRNHPESEIDFQVEGGELRVNLVASLFFSMSTIFYGTLLIVVLLTAALLG